MHIRNHRKQTLKTRLIILSATGFIFIVSFILNIVLSLPLYYENLNIVPTWQNNPVMGTSAFMTFMNVVSMVMDPSICSGYIFIIYLISYRKLEIITFLLWFFFLSWLLGIMKMAIHQPRPYMIPGTQVIMESWTCYTDFGSPSGHAMLTIVLFEFLLRFYARVHHCVHKYIAIFYIIVFFFQLLVMFSRVMLGMHTFNQVLFGLSIGLFSFIPYYLFVQAFIMKIVLKIFSNQKSWASNLVILLNVILFLGISLMVALIPTYNETQYFNVIQHTKGCQHAKAATSFQYSCLIGTSIISAGFGVLLGLNYMHKPDNLAKVLSYSRLSIKFVSKILLTIVIAAIPLVIFMNPLWHKIKTDNIGVTMIQWACSNLAFFCATFVILYIPPFIGQKLGLEGYSHPSSYAQYKKFQVINMLDFSSGDIVVSQIKKRRQTQMTDPRFSQYGKK